MAQMFLIEVGLVLLLISFRIFMKESSDFHKLSHHSDQETHHRPVIHALHPAHNHPAPAPRKGIKATARAMTKGLLRTSSVKFVQTFKFRENDPLHRNLPHQ